MPKVFQILGNSNPPIHLINQGTMHKLYKDLDSRSVFKKPKNFAIGWKKQKPLTYPLDKSKNYRRFGLQFWLSKTLQIFCDLHCRSSDLFFST